MIVSSRIGIPEGASDSQRDSLSEKVLETACKRGKGENNFRKEISMRTFFSLVLAAALLFSSTVFAEGLKVQDAMEEYVAKFVTAKNVKGVELRLSKEIVRNDCNTRMMSLDHARVSGSGDGWYDRYFMDAHITQTKMHCPLDKEVTETIYSAPVFIKSFANENVNNEVRVSVVIPKGYQLEAHEVK